MIEWHVDLIAPWWVIPLYLGGVVVTFTLIYVIGLLIGRWFDR